MAFYQDIVIGQNSDEIVQAVFAPVIPGGIANEQFKMSVWASYAAQQAGTAPVITKVTGVGQDISILDPVNCVLQIAFHPADTASLAFGDYPYAISRVDAGNTWGATYGLLKVTPPRAQ